MSSWKTTLIGDYDWGFLCAPRKFWKSGAAQAPPFFGRDEPISVFVAAVMGLQHALAMVSRGNTRNGVFRGWVALKYCSESWGTSEVYS